MTRESSSSVNNKKPALGLAIAAFLVMAGGLITGPLQARALGPVGRGDVAAIFVPFTLLAWVADLGLTAVATKVAASRNESRHLLAAIYATVFVSSVMLTLLLWPFANSVIGNGNEELADLFRAALLVQPLAALTGVQFAAGVGRRRWRSAIIARATPAIVSVSVISILYATSRLTVVTAVTTMISATLLSAIPFLRIPHGLPDFALGFKQLKHEIVFGLKSWTSTIGAVTNARLDQLLMVGLTTRHELGIYAVAVALTAVLGVVPGAVGQVLQPAAARNEFTVVRRWIRLVVGFLVGAALAMVLAAPTLVPLLLTEKFVEAVPIVMVLAVASVPLHLSRILGSTCVQLGAPGRAGLAEGSAAILTVVGLFILIPVMGAMGAALVSLAAYSVAFAVVVKRVGDLTHSTISDLLLARPSDIVGIGHGLLTAFKRATRKS